MRNGLSIQAVNEANQTHPKDAQTHTLLKQTLTLKFNYQERTGYRRNKGKTPFKYKQVVTFTSVKFLFNTRKLRGDKERETELCS